MRQRTLALIVGVIVLLVLWVARRSGPPGGDSGGGDHADALRILEDRFARGEIDREEFEERRRTLRGGPP